MSKGARQKQKLLYLMKIFYEHTDCEHSLTISDMINLLDEYGISAERKSLYDDIESLRQFGIDIETQKGKSFGYYVASRDFELPELKLLVDAVQSSKFITHKKSRELIKKLESFSSMYQARTLDRQVFVANRIKTMNESIYYTVDYIHEAISGNRKISFKYFDWTPDKEKIFRHGGKLYSVSPLALIWDDENYYLVAFDSDEKKVKHYRVDKIEKISVTEEIREGTEEFSEFDTALYSKGVFGMFGGKAEFVSLLCDNSLAGVIIDRFGNEQVLIKRSDDKFEISVKVVLSPQFYSWVFGFSGRIKILSPQKACDEFAGQLKTVSEQYK